MHSVFMEKPDTLALIEEAAELCGAATTTDAEGTTNAEKWNFIQGALGIPDIFQVVDYEKAYAGETAAAIAAGYLAELRVQYLYKRLQERPDDLNLHRMYVRNCIWAARLREALFLEATMQAARRMRTH